MAGHQEWSLPLLPDTHAHLDAFAGEIDAVLARAEQAGVDRILAVGSDLATSRQAVGLAQRHGMVYAAVGIHPHEASHFAREAADVRSLLSEGKVVAVGEIGLDYHRDWVAGADQRTAFVEQVQWARDRDLPVSVHNRDADVDVLAILRQQGVRGVLHCFSGSWDFARSALDASMHLSFAGNLTYPKAADLREVAAKVPLDRTLIETDAPVLAPQPWRGRRNEPAFILATLEALAQVRGVSASCLATCVSRNADSLFAWRGG